MTTKEYDEKNNEMIQGDSDDAVVEKEFSKKQEQLIKIMEAYHSGNMGKRQKAMTDMLDLIQGFIGRMIRKHFGGFAQDYYHDLYSEGVVAVMESMEKFDPSKGCTVTTFFTPYILHAMSEYINTETHQSTSYYSGIMRKIKEAQKYYDERQSVPTMQDIALYTGLSIKKVEDGLERINATNMFRYDSDEDLDAALNRQSKNPEQELLEKEEEKILYDALFALTEIDRKVLYLRFGFDDGIAQSIGKIAKILNIPVNQVTNSINRSIRILKHDPGLMGLYGKGASAYRNNTLSNNNITFVQTQKVIDLYNELGEDDDEELDVCLGGNTEEETERFVLAF